MSMTPEQQTKLAAFKQVKVKHARLEEVDRAVMRLRIPSRSGNNTWALGIFTATWSARTRSEGPMSPITSA